MRELAIITLLVLISGPAAVRAAESNAAPVGRAGPTATDRAAARQVVEALHEVLLACMKDADGLGFQGRYERIADSLDETFDLSFMARAALGAAWKQLTEQELADFVDLSGRLSATRYADNFDSYEGQRFETRSDEPAARGTIMVMTEFVQPRDDDVRFDYRLRRVAGEWRVIDVMLDGMISELAARRSQYRSLIEREGFARLVEVMKTKIAELSSE